MMSHPRIRKTFKWACAAVTVLLLVVWRDSHQVNRTWIFREFRLSTSDGEFFPWAMVPHSRPGPQNEVIREFGQMAIWPFVAVAGTATAAVWMLDVLATRSRARLNLCPKCHYDRTGLAAGAVCPECGKLPA